MRDDSYLTGDVSAKPTRRIGFGAAATAIGATASVAILAGVVIWSYRLGVRDAAEIPVIRAELGPTKVRPEEAGGSEAPHRDRAVFEVVTGAAPERAAAPALAPAPEPLSEEDVAPIARTPDPSPRPAAETPAAAPEVAAPPAPEPLETAEANPAAEPETEPAVDPLASAVEAAVAEALAEPVGDDAALGAPRYSPAAPPRPERASAAAPDPAKAAAAAAASAVQIQLGAFESEAVADEQWALIVGKNADLLGGRGRVVTPVSSGGRKLWRLRSGPFESVAEAAALCRGLAARGQDCIVARAR